MPELKVFIDDEWRNVEDMTKAQHIELLNVMIERAKEEVVQRDRYHSRPDRDIFLRDIMILAAILKTVIEPVRSAGPIFGSENESPHGFS